MDFDDPTLICPYVKAHAFPKSRMQLHLTKCRPQHPSKGKKICPYNTTHIIPTVEYDYHLKFCEDRIMLDTFTCKVGSSSASKLQLSKVEPIVIKGDENWEICIHLRCCNDLHAYEAFTSSVGCSEVPKVEFSTEPIEIIGNESWDVSEEARVSVLEKVHEVSKTKPTLSALIGAPKSERKAFRNQERLRMQQVLELKEKEEKERARRKTEVEEGSGQKGQQSEESSKKDQQSKGSGEEGQQCKGWSRGGSLKERVAAEMVTFNQAQAQSRAAMKATGAVPKTTKSANPSTTQSFARTVAQRDQRDAWGTMKQIEQLDITGGGDAPSRDEGVSATTSFASDVRFKPPSQAWERDPTTRQSFARTVAQRDQRDAWGTMKRNEQLDTTGGDDAPSRDESVSAATSSASDVRFTPSSQARERDPTNPWNVRKPPSSPSTSNTSEAEDFPSLPASGRGRGKRN